MIVKLALVIYNVIFTLALPLIFLRLFLRGCRLPAYRGRWLERLGFFNSPTIKGGVWVHAVSVGEAAAAVPIIKALQIKYPKMPITVTTTTPTGSQRVRQVLGDSVFHVYCPYDLPWCVHHFLKRIQPDVVVIMETELWPNLLALLKRNRIPVILSNARLSPSSYQNYLRFSNFSQKMLANVSIIAAQSTIDAKRFARLAGTHKNIDVTGNVKYDIALSPSSESDEQLSSLHQRAIWIAASTHRDEEEQILQAHCVLLKHDPRALLILVPRHPDRFREVEQLLLKNTTVFSYLNRSEGQHVAKSHNVLLADTMGELATLYAKARIAFVGGSLVPIGGHNLLEPASLALPIISGHFLHNFKAVSEALMAQNALLVVQNPTQLADSLISLWDNIEERVKMGQRALNVVKNNQGAVDKTIAFIESSLHQSQKARL